MSNVCPSLLVVLVFAGVVAGCDFPRDPDSTTEDVLARGSVRIGLVEGDADADGRALADRIAMATSTQLEIVRGDTELLLPQLERGDLDVVVGRFAENSPWRDRVAFTAAERNRNADNDAPVLRAAVRNGENRWLMTVDQAVKEVP